MLDPIADVMCVRYGSPAGYHQVEIYERCFAGVARSEVVGFNRTYCLCRNHGFDLGERIVWYSFVHEAAERGRHHFPAGPENIDCNKAGQRWVKHRPAGFDGEENAKGDTNRGDDVREQVMTVGN